MRPSACCVLSQSSLSSNLPKCKLNAATSSAISNCSQRFYGSTMARLVVSLCVTIFLLVSQLSDLSEALSFPCRRRRLSRNTFQDHERRLGGTAISCRPIVQSRLHAFTPRRPNGDASNDNVNSNNNGKNEAAPSILNGNGAYSNHPNAWGYSRTVVNDRERRRYERQRIRHRSKFFGSTNTGEGINGKAATAQFDDKEMDEDGYWGMFGRSSKRGFLVRAFQGILQVPRGLFRARSVEPGTLILVRHGESLWNANKTFTGEAGFLSLHFVEQLRNIAAHNESILLACRVGRSRSFTARIQRS